MATIYSWTLESTTSTFLADGLPKMRRNDPGRSIRFANVFQGKPENVVHGGPRVNHVGSVLTPQQLPIDVTFANEANIRSGAIRFRGTRGRINQIPRNVRVGLVSEDRNEPSILEGSMAGIASLVGALSASSGSVGGDAGVGGGQAASTSSFFMIVSQPSYIWPGNTDWDRIEALGGSKIGYTLVNPKNGPGYGTTYEPGGGTHTAYTNRITTVRAAGIEVLHYISLNYRDEYVEDDTTYYRGTVGVNYRFRVSSTSTETLETMDDAGSVAKAHGWSTGFGPVQVKSWAYDNTASSLAGGLSASFNYWFIKVDSTKFKLATSYNNAISGTAVNISSAGSNTGGSNGPAQYIGISRTLANISNVYEECALAYERYPDINGFFFDEALLTGGPNMVPYCSGVFNYVKSLDPNFIVCWNGLATSSIVMPYGDLFVEEGTVASLLSTTFPAYMSSSLRSKFWLMGNAGSTSQTASFIAKASSSFFGHISMNGSSYSSLPTFFEDFVATVSASNR